MDIRAEVDELVRQFVDDLEELVRKAALASVAEALESGTAVSSSPSPRRSPSKRSSATKKRSRSAPRSKAGKEKLAREIVDYVTENPGAKMEDMKAAIGEETKFLRPIVNKLLANGHIRKTGERRATRYFPKGS
ncbi:MAG TPA: hypothetical protein RMH99_00650 [Sandaracinaceae bacterium LLY-WYZ-13_1]|nr:hypothetical protein [Sandaracinaceae bacterium LLY-WYZ-13_1]